MKKQDQQITLSLLVCALLLSSFSCAKKQDESVTTTASETLAKQRMTIKISAQTFTATLLDNYTAKAFLQKLPMTFQMTELNGNEKYHDLSASLPAQAGNPDTIRTGDIMLYGSKTLVMFYKDFQTPYNYTKIASIDNTEGFAAALGAENVTVTLEIN